METDHRYHGPVLRHEGEPAMKLLRRLWKRWIGMLPGSHQNRALADEIAFHIQMQTEDNLNHGLSPEEARRQAIVKFGGIDTVKERYREQCGVPYLELWLKDIGFALRSLCRAPGITFITLLVFALGIGINTAIFSIVNAALFRPRPARSPHELASVYSMSTKGGRLQGISYPDYMDMRSHRDIFSGMLAFVGMPAPVMVGQHSELSFCELVSANYFDVLGIEPVLGRTFPPLEAESESAEPMAVVSHAFWKRRLHEDPSAPGTRLKIGDKNFIVIGVAPPSFSGFWLPEAASTQVWIPLTMAASIRDSRLNLSDRSRDHVLAIGRLASGISFKQAQTFLDLKTKQLQQTYPQIHGGRFFRLFPTDSIRILPDPSADRIPRLIAVAILTVSGIVLLIAGINIVGLISARGIVRKKEIAMRRAFGADGWRIARQLLIESLLLSGCGGILGLLLTRILINLALSYVPRSLEFLPLALNIPIDFRVILFTALLCLGTGLFVSLMPAVRASQTNIAASLTADGIVAAQNEHRVISRWILIPQVACSLVLLLIAGLFIKTVLKERWTDPGYKTANAAIANINLRWNYYSEENGRAFYRRLLSAARSIPGVAAASLADGQNIGSTAHVEIMTERDALAGRQIRRTSHFSRISPGYFRTLSIAMLRGRDFDDRDAASAPCTAIVSEHAARRFWPGVDPIGQRIIWINGINPTLEIVGIVKDIRASAFEEKPHPHIYVPIEQHYDPHAMLIARGTGDSMLLSEQLNQCVYHLDGTLAAVECKPLSSDIGFFIFLLRMAAGLLGVCGFLGLMLAAVGLYGVVSFSMTQRTREIGIRMALGARHMDIARMALAEGFKVILGGTILGLWLTYAAKSYIETFSFGLVALDPIILAGVPISLSLIILLACYIPARRAWRIDPSVALREL